MDTTLKHPNAETEHLHKALHHLQHVIEHLPLPDRPRLERMLDVMYQEYFRLLARSSTPG